MTNAAGCIHCGGDGVPHRVTYITVALDDTLRPLFTPGFLFKGLARFFNAIESCVTPHILRFLVWVGLAKKQERPDDETLLLAKVLWEEADARGIEMWEFRLFGLARNIFHARLPGGRRVAFEGIPQPPSGISRVWWMDNKTELKKQLRKAGFPTAHGGGAFTERAARRLYAGLTPPVIVKPHSGSGSRHTILHIRDEKGLLDAFRVAKQVAPLALIEEELTGPVYRITVVDGRYSATLRRDPPSVVGDGKHTVLELVEKANTHPARGGPYFSKLKVDDYALEELAWQGYTPESVPAAGTRVMLHQKVNWGLGGTTADATDGVHPDNVRMFEEVAELLKAPIVGIDFIIEDLARPWHAQDRCGILECNSMPFFDNHHLPFEGKVRNVSGDIWDMTERAYR
ncbi:MAG: cyanophycin synthetase [Candidatus Parcubacteria bacterium]|jgi:D-alanine-D-alanine ligase-like ATP-grasp enzyme|nr:cyanophycin synthetase [Candidatus Parcubacteria bacterium]